MFTSLVGFSLILGAVAGPTDGVQTAQDAAGLAALAAAFAFVRDSIPGDVVVLDSDAPRFSIPQKLASAFAAKTGIAVEPGRIGRACRGQGRSQRCSLGGRTAVIAFRPPVLQGGVAFVEVQWNFAPDDRELAFRYMKLELHRTNGAWIVARVLDEEIS